MPFLVLTLVCGLEACLHRHENIQITFGTGATSLAAVQGWYPHAYTYDNERDNEAIHPEGYESALFAYAMAGTNRPEAGVSFGYPPSMYRLMQPLLASFLLKVTSLRTAYLLVNTLVWVLAAWATFWLGWRLFQSRAVGVIGGLLCATSYAFIVLVTTDKAEMLQLGGYFGLVALSLALGCYDPAWSLRSLGGAFVMGLVAGLGVFASNTTVYFLAFFSIYCIMSVGLSIMFCRSALLMAGLMAVYASIRPFIHVSSDAEMSQWVMAALSQPDWLRRAWQSTQMRFQSHFIYIVPWHLWLGAAAGLFLLTRDQRKAILCLFVTLFVSEALMLVGQRNACWGWTLNYYYLQVLLPIYLLNARLLWFLVAEGSRGGVVVTELKRAAAVALAGLTLFTSHLELLGNKYNYYNIRPVSIEVLYHSYFTYDNLQVYRDMANR